MNMHADFLSTFGALGNHLALDKTGLNGSYDFVLKSVTPGPSQDPGTDLLFTALQRQLGLKLELRQATNVEVLLIENAEEPTAD